MQLVGAGLSKTGTTSLHRACSMLGYRSLHYDRHRLTDILDGSTAHPDFRRYDDIDAVFDIPSACFYRELLEAYPRSKCILTLRDEDSWWLSIERHFAKPVTRNLTEARFKSLSRCYAYGSDEPREYIFRKRYREHNAQVIDSVAPGRLLVMDLNAGDGWDKLCEFLDREPPGVAFPHQNPATVEKSRSNSHLLETLLSVPGGVGAVIMVDDWEIDDACLPGVAAYRFSGLPANDAAAIEELKAMVRSGATHIAFVEHHTWWLDFYHGLREQLEDQGQRLYWDQHGAIFRLPQIPHSTTGN